MAVVSKFLDETIIKAEKLGISKQALSQGIVGIAIASYVLHLSYPHLAKLVKAAKLSPVLSTATSDEDDDDDDFDTDTDEYETTASVCSEIHSTSDNNNILDNDETMRGIEEQTNVDGEKLLCVPAVKRIRKHSKVIKQQIKQAEQLLATQERKNSTKDGPMHLNNSEDRIGLNLEFLMKLKKLIEIMIPKLWCREVGILGVHTACLISRTFLSIYVAAIEGAIVKYIVRKDLKQFIFGLMKWFGIAVPATFINSMIRYLENKLALSFR